MTESPKLTHWDRRSPIAVLAGVLLLALSGCTDPFLGGGAISNGGATTESPTPASGDSEEEIEVETVLSVGECIVGSWLLDNQSFSDLMTELGDNIFDDVTGTARFSAAADGTAVTEYVEWKHVIRMANPEGIVTLVRNGQDSGTYTVEADDTITLQEDNNASVIHSSFEGGGTAMDLPPIEGSPGALHLGVFSCLGNELTITVDGRSTVMQRES